MIDGLKPYPAMKDSGVSWLGEVPEHWEVNPNRALFEEIKDQNHPDEPLLSVTISKGVIRQSDLLSDTSKKDSSNLDRSKYKLVQPGDIAYNKMRAWQGAIGLSHYRGIISPAYIVQRPQFGVAAEYMHYLLRTPRFAKEAERWSYGITSDMWSLRSEHFKMIYCSVPPLPEQAAIVRFLDHADRRIQRYIRGKQKLIRLLEEQKQAIIHRGVTRGLDPNVRLKPSGVEWLGDVPEHWHVVRLKFVAKKMVDCLHATPQYSDNGEFPAIRTADVAPGVVRHESARRVFSEVFERWTQRLEPIEGDILYSREGERFGIAACVPARVRLCISQRMMVFRIRNKYNPHFIMWLLNSPQTYAQACQDVMGATAPHVNISTIRNFQFALPARDEQDAILAEIEASTVGFSTSIAAAQKEIALIREFRTRLIADAVTGKLDVREAAAKLPDEAPEVEPLDEVEDVMQDELVAEDIDIEAADAA